MTINIDIHNSDVSTLAELSTHFSDEQITVTLRFHVDTDEQEGILIFFALENFIQSLPKTMTVRFVIIPNNATVVLCAGVVSLLGQASTQPKPSVVFDCTNLNVLDDFLERTVDYPMVLIADLSDVTVFTALPCMTHMKSAMTKYKHRLQSPDHEVELIIKEDPGVSGVVGIDSTSATRLIRDMDVSFHVRLTVT